MTRLELQQKVDYYRRKLDEYQKELDKMEMVFDIHDYNKPFKKYSLAELQHLKDCSEKAYEYSLENKEENIYDYNLVSLKDDRVNLAR